MLARYAQCGLAYGVFHSVVNLWDFKWHYYCQDCAAAKKQLLVADKLAWGCALTALSAGYWPVFLHHDLQRLECRLRGGDAAHEYGVRHLFLDT